MRLRSVLRCFSPHHACKEWFFEWTFLSAGNSLNAIKMLSSLDVFLCREWCVCENPRRWTVCEILKPAHQALTTLPWATCAFWDCGLVAWYVTRLRGSIIAFRTLFWSMNWMYRGERLLIYYFFLILIIIKKKKNGECRLPIISMQSANFSSKALYLVGNKTKRNVVLKIKLL